MLLVVRVIGVLVLWFAQVHANARDVYVLVMGDGTSANCNARVFGATSGVYQIGLDGIEKPARDPLESADCQKGSIWLPLGQQMIKAGVADKVIFMSIGVAGTSARGWQAGGVAFAKLAAVTRTVNARKIKFDYALWQHSDTGSDTRGRDCIAEMRKVVRAMSIAIKIDKWIIGQSKGCGDGIEGDPPINQWNPLFNRFSGPNTSTLDSSYRSASEYLNELGQLKLAHLWFRSIVEADAASARYQKESLLYYFK
jgi:hypothetical protein